jgi:hypothetical protein
MDQSPPDASDPRDVAAVRWAPLVDPGPIRRLYETDALGIVDEDQINDVGYALEARCRSILRATEAHRGRVTCPRCEHPIDRERPRHGQREALVRCARCGWRVRWGEYFATYQHRHLVGGAALPFYEAFLAQFERARTPQEKLLAIDRLIHAFHGELARNPVRSAARELIRAPHVKALLGFLDTLTYGAGSTPGLRESKAAWDRKVDDSARYRTFDFRAPERAPDGPRPGARRGGGATG